VSCWAGRLGWELEKGRWRKGEVGWELEAVEEGSRPQDCYALVAGLKVEQGHGCFATHNNRAVTRTPGIQRLRGDCKVG
jgi:hypothetical protein